MGSELWTSPVTGYRRIGTRFSDVRALFDRGITAVAIFEPLKSCPIYADARETKELLTKRDFDVAGVMESEGGPILGYVQRSDLESGQVRDYLKLIPTDLLIADSAPIPELFALLSNNDFLFVLNKTRIEGIVTRADLNKPPVRIYLFGLVSLLEMHLGFWVKTSYENETWKEKISPGRLEAAQNLFIERTRSNRGIGLFECLQFGDKRDLLLRKADLRNELLTGSKRESVEIFKQAEALRNTLAHSQQDISLGLGWDTLFQAVSWMEKFLRTSDHAIESRAQNISKNYDDRLW